MSSELDALPLNSKNPGPFVICAVLVDVSSSMNFPNGEPIHELNKGYSEFRRFIRDDDLASQRTQVVVIEFNSSARVAVPLQRVGRSPSTLSPPTDSQRWGRLSIKPWT